MNETTTEVLSDNPETTESFITHLSKNNDSTKVDIDTTTPMISSSVSVNLTTEKPVSNESTTSVNPTTQKQVFNESTTSVNPTTQKLAFNESTTSVNSTTVKLVSNESTTSVNVENSTVSVSTEYESSTTMVETTVELTTTTEATTSTTSVPADCPVLKDCPFDYCAFARKLDNRGCPTCNCLHSNKSNITCPTFTCQACLYGHYTDPNGVNINHYLKLFLYIQFF